MIMCLVQSRRLFVRMEQGSPARMGFSVRFTVFGIHDNEKPDCDSPKDTVISAIKFAASVDPRFILYIGDSVTTYKGTFVFRKTLAILTFSEHPKHYQDASMTIRDIHAVADLIQQVVQPTIPVYPTLGPASLLTLTVMTASFLTNRQSRRVPDRVFAPRQRMAHGVCQYLVDHSPGHASPAALQETGSGL